jgi:tellurite resistance protein
MELKIPSPEQAYWGLRAMKTVALADGMLDDSERHMMEAVQRVFGTTHEIEQLAPITPAELARAFPDPQLRQQLVQGLIVMSLIDGKANAQETDLVEQFAQALEVSAPEVKDLRHVLKGEILQLRLDLVRRFWLRPKVNEIWNTEGIRGLYTLPGPGALSSWFAGACLLGVLPNEWLCTAGGKGWSARTNFVSRLRAHPIRLWNGSGGRGSSGLFQRRLPAA